MYIIYDLEDKIVFFQSILGFIMLVNDLSTERP